MKLHYIILVSCLMLTSCLSPVKPDQTSNYVINKIPMVTAHKNISGNTILILQPDTRPVYNTTRMAYTIKPYQVAYFGQNEWAETPSQMLQPLILQTLQNTHHYHAVVSAPYTGKYDYILTTQILQLEQDLIHQPEAQELTVRAILSKVSSNRVVATKQFTIRVPLAQKTPYGGVLAANQAAGIFLEELSKFCQRYS